MHILKCSRVEAKELTDTDLLEKIAQHEVLLKKQDAIMTGQKEIIEAHESLQEDFSTLSLTEMEVQITKMPEGPKELMADRETLREEHEQMEKDRTMMLERIKYRISCQERLSYNIFEAVPKRQFLFL